MFQIQKGDANKETYFLCCRKNFFFYWNYFSNDIKTLPVRSGKQEKEQNKHFRVTI